MQLPRTKHMLAILAMQAPLTLAMAVPVVGVELGMPTPAVSKAISARTVLSSLWDSLLSGLGMATRDTDNIDYGSYGAYGYYGEYADYGAYGQPTPEFPDTSPTPTTPECETTSTTPVPETTYYSSSSPDDNCTTSADYYPTTTGASAPTATYLTSVGTPIWTYSSSSATSSPYNAGGDTDSTIYVTQPVTTVSVALSSLRTTHDLKTYTWTIS